ncbi:MAG: CoA transferase [Chloroflexi bacterium]|nr:CoA transferase [Chloroflexota bacterium]
MPLSHITVIDLTRQRSGPTCIRQLGDMGAQIIKVESPEDEDGTANRHTSDFQNLHPNKRSMLLNLKSERGKEVLFRLVERADVVVENFRPDVKHRLGVDYETLSRVNPRIVYGSISGFGQEGPYRTRPGLDQIAQGLSGVMSVTGLPGQGPVRAGIPIADLAAGVMLAYGIVVALLERERSGRGQWVHTSLLQAMVRMMDLQTVRWLQDGLVPKQEGNYHPVHVPVGALRAKDGSLNVQASSNTLFGRLCAALGVPVLADDPRFKEFKDRQAHREELIPLIEARLATRTVAEWVELLNEAGVPAGPILNVKESFENEQVQTLPMVHRVEHPKLGEVTVLGFGVNLSRTPPRIKTAAPERGAHTREVLAELGYSTAEIDALEREGVVGDVQQMARR